MINRPHGETNVTVSCQNRCVSCNHFIVIQKPWFAKPEIIERDLAMAAKIVHFHVYNLVGGEPTLHPRMMEIIRIIRQSGITDRIEITSNGQNFGRLPDAMYQEIDDLIVTPYKIGPEERGHIQEKCNQYGTTLQWHPVIFTWAATKEPHTPELAADLYHNCWYNINRHVIDDGFFYRCCTSPFIPQLLLGKAKTTDGISLEGLTEDRLQAYLTQPETPTACTVCASNRGAQIPWREQADPAKWLDESLA